MTQSHMRVGEVDVLPLALALRRQPELFGRHGARRYSPGSPHVGMSDVWVRYNDCAEFEAGRRPWSEFNDEHDSVWYPEADAIPQVRPIVFSIMSRVEGERLGGVLITKIAPGERVAPHVDGGWHAGYYDKFFVAVQNAPGAVFAFEDGEIHPRPGEVWWFRNDVPHWVVNESNEDRLAMIVCIRMGARR
jgi:quercetin dioxygenase-like cupin family protein